MTRALAFMAALLWVAPASAETTYFSEIVDLPIPPGFAEVQGWTMDTNEGRLTEARAEGRGDPASLRNFYLETLPALGWSNSPQSDQSLEFNRGRERLMFSFSAPSSGRALVRARLVVRPTPSAH